MSSTRRGPLNLAELVPKLPEVIVPSGSVIQVAPFTAASYEKYRQLQGMTYAGMQENGTLDEDKYLTLLDEVLALVLPTATKDDLASFGSRLEIKLSVIAVASGRVDEVVAALDAASFRKEDEGNVDQPLH